jgi:hypothetical protein
MIHHLSPLRVLAFAASFVCVAAAPARGSQPAEPPPIHFSGRFLGFVEGDSQWAVFCVSGDSILTVGISAPDVGFFVAAHAGAKLDIEAKVVDTYTSDTGTVEPIYGMTAATLKGYTAKTWWDEMVRVLGWDRACKAINALSEAMDMEGEPPSCKY